MRIIDIGKYIEKYENGEMTTIQIAMDLGVSRGTVENRLKKYYSDKKRPPKKQGSKKNVDIKPYIEKYENKEMTVIQIAQKLGVSAGTIYNRLKKYNKEQEEIKNVRNLKEELKKLIEQGLPEEKIIAVALKRNITIPKLYFEEIYKEINNGLDREDD